MQRNPAQPVCLFCVPATIFPWAVLQSKPRNTIRQKLVATPAFAINKKKGERCQVRFVLNKFFRDGFLRVQ